MTWINKAVFVVLKPVMVVFLYSVDDDPIGRALAAYGQWAHAEINLLLAFVGLDSTVVDIGANVGTHSLAFGRRVGPHGAVHAFELQRQVFALLERNMTTYDVK